MIAAEEILCNTYGGHGIGTVVIGVDFLGVLFGEHRTAHADFAVRDGLLQKVDGFFHVRYGRGHQGGEADQLDIVFLGLLDDLFAGDVFAQVDDREVVAFQQDAGDIFADVMDVAFHG